MLVLPLLSISLVSIKLFLTYLEQLQGSPEHSKTFGNTAKKVPSISCSGLMSYDYDQRLCRLLLLIFLRYTKFKYLHSSSGWMNALMNAHYHFLKF